MKGKKNTAKKIFIWKYRKGFGRFLSIFFIVATRLRFFGNRAAEPDMRLSGDEYFDQSKLMDLQSNQYDETTTWMTYRRYGRSREWNRHSLSIYGYLV